MGSHYWVSLEFPLILLMEEILHRLGWDKLINYSNQWVSMISSINRIPPQGEKPRKIIDSKKGLLAGRKGIWIWVRCGSLPLTVANKGLYIGIPY